MNFLSYFLRKPLTGQKCLLRSRLSISSCSKCRLNRSYQILRTTFCNHRESPDNFNFFESLIISPKIPFDELFLKKHIKIFERYLLFQTIFRKTNRAPEVSVFECKLCTKAQHHRILQKSTIRLLTKPSLSFFCVCYMIKYAYLNK